MRAGTAFLVTLGVLLGLAVAADALVTSDAEERASAHVGALLGAEADVTLEGWPVALRLLAGRVPEVRVVATDVAVGDELHAQRVDMRLLDVRLRLADLSGSEPPALRARRGGTLVAEFDKEAVARLAELDGDITFGQGIARLETDAGAVDLAAAVEEGRVVLRAIGSAPEHIGPVTVAVPPLPGNPTVDEVRIIANALRVTGRVTQLRPADF